MTDDHQTATPHWQRVLAELWDLCDGELFEPIDLPAYCERNGYDQEMVELCLYVWGAGEYIEWGVSVRYPWFCKDYE